MGSSETSTTPVSLPSRICWLSSAWFTLSAIYSRNWGLARHMVLCFKRVTILPSKVLLRLGERNFCSCSL